MEPDSASRDTRGMVDELLGRLGEGDLPAVAALFAAEFDWRLSWPDRELTGAVPWIRERHTPGDVLNHFRSLAEHNTPHGFGTSVHQIVVEGENAVILGTIRNVMHRTHTPYTARFALHLGVEGGLITRYHIYEDSLAVAEAWHNRQVSSVGSAV